MAVCERFGGQSAREALPGAALERRPPARCTVCGATGRTKYIRRILVRKRGHSPVCEAKHTANGWHVASQIESKLLTFFHRLPNDVG